MRTSGWAFFMSIESCEMPPFSTIVRWLAGLLDEISIRACAAHACTSASFWLSSNDTTGCHHTKFGTGGMSGGWAVDGRGAAVRGVRARRELGESSA